MNEKPLAENDWRIGDRGAGVSWIARLYHLKGDYYLSGFFTGMKNNKRMDPMILKSKSGKPEGPYAFYRDTNIESLVVDDDGTLYAIPCSAVGTICRLTDDLKVDPNARFSIRIADGTERGNDAGCALAKHDGKYLFMGLNEYGAYDQTWYWSDRIDGVYRPVSVLPYTGNGNIVRHSDGRVYTSNQSGTYENPTQNSFIWPLHVDMKANPPVIEHEFEHDAGVREMSVY